MAIKLGDAGTIDCFGLAFECQTQTYIKRNGNKQSHIMLKHGMHQAWVGLGFFSDWISFIKITIIIIWQFVQRLQPCRGWGWQRVVVFWGVEGDRSVVTCLLLLNLDLSEENKRVIAGES